MKIKIKIFDEEKLKETREAIKKLDNMNLQDTELELTEENLKKAKEIKDLCSKGWFRTEIKIVSSDGTELTKL